FYTRRAPTAVAHPGPIRVNHALAALLGIDPLWLESDEGTAVLAGNSIAAGSDPIATVYAGHQFGSYNPQLGDGRAILLGEVIGADGIRYDIQLKGSGPTPYSRGGDGRAPLAAVLREYIVSEAMHTLGLPTTRALAAVTTGEQVVRESFLPGAVLTRVARSHIRIGTFQFFAARQDVEALKLLVEHVLARHYPDAPGQDNPALALLQQMIGAQAGLIAQWQLLGFIHGVMNTDNMLLSGETIDYGPCAFMDDFQPDKVYSSIDRAGRYAYNNQPGIAHWNLAALAQALLPALHEDQEQAVALAQGAVDTFPEQFTQAHRAGLAIKLGLVELRDSDQALADELFQLMAQHQLDFTLTFRRLADLAGPTGGSNGTMVAGLFEIPDPLLPWLARWRERLSAEQTTATERQAQMYSANPVFIPRNHLVEEALQAATEQGDFAPFNALVDVLARPFAYDEALARYATPPRPEQVVRQTFCGT
ncbi:MAG: YdiU family protein, partial [Albidovulum sp.]|uniref:protein adenylyltransferase SelO n=1 Tax=Albidovulum sp. TaxID=1872424 RepID=UPI003CAB0B4C